ncbi:MAG TPA: prolyl oligopeptidase family serine peptidase [Caulobacteraceae bacterium]|nr:prolyl oligopeptidase family serine peptidase [Caulobacteraceae bacterium]
MRAAICAFLFGFVSSGSMAATTSPAPVFPPGDTVDMIHGVEVRDPYRALENGDEPQVKAWSDAENTRTRAYLDALPGRAAVAAKLTRLIKAASASYTSLQARGERIFALYSDPARQQPWLVTLAASADPGTRKSLVDPNSMDPGGHIAIDWYVPSPDGALAAVSLSRNGSEDGTLHIYDVATGAEIGEPISRVQYPTAGGALAWTADGKGFWYTRYPGDDAPEAERHFNIAVYFHKLGAPLASDTLVLSKKDGVPRTGEVFLDNRAGGHAVLASVQLGDGGQWQQFVLREGQPPLKIAAYEDRIIAGAIAKDGTVYGLSRKDAPAGKVLKLSPPYAGGFAAAGQIIASMAAAAIVDGGEFGSPLSVTEAHLFVTRIVGGPVEVDAYDLDGGHPMKLPTPPVAAVNEVDPLPNGDALYSVMTYLDPPFFMRWSAATGEAERTALAMTSPVSYADATVTRVFATSKDGTKVPLNVIAKKDVKLDGSNPVLLYGYGGYGVNMTPSFSGGFRRMWLDAGGIYVVANLRGGGEYGDRWHREGMLTHKQNVFDDFAAAGETLIKLGYTNHDKLALMGGSNGGLLMGATIVQRPKLARAVVSAVGIYDMMRFERDPNGAFNTSEFGSISDPEQLKALYAYSPIHHVVPGTDYPAVLMETGANDGRVNPMNSRKFTALLQAAQADKDHPIVLRTSQNSGHGIGTSLDERIAEITDDLMFLYDQIGMSAQEAAK